MRWRGGGGNARTGWPVIDEVVLEEAGHGRHCCLRRDALLQFARLFINKAQENVIAAQRLTDVAYAWLLCFHPGINDGLKRGHVIPALRAIKALEPVHVLILSVSKQSFAV
jgi:hypothetical protein